MNTIILQVRNDKNEHLVCLRVTYKRETDLKLALERSLPGFLTHGVLVVESNHIKLKLNGVPFQEGTNAQEERSKHYQETGN